MKKLIYILICLCFLSSCLNEKRICGDNRIYSVSKMGDSCFSHNIRKTKNCEIIDNGQYLIIKNIAEGVIDTTNIPTNIDANKVESPITGWRLESPPNYYFPESKFIDANKENTFRYYDGKIILQALTIPLKIRPSLRNIALKDSFPGTVETGTTFGLSFGYKLNYNVYKANKNILGQNTNRWSLSTGIVLGSGGVDLKKANTRNPQIAFERKAAIVSPGVFFMFGFNSVNVGYMLGKDYATGIGRKEWLYQGKSFHGLIVAIDLIK